MPLPGAFTSSLLGLDSVPSGFVFSLVQVPCTVFGLCARPPSEHGIQGVSPIAMAIPGARNKSVVVVQSSPQRASTNWPREELEKATRCGVTVSQLKFVTET
jgi:hypothetical protein